ncbi:MAG: S24/S26 family peptidase [Candidatus Sulfotelmatobacter sp.]
MKPLPPASGEAHAVKCELAGDILHSSGTLRLRVMGWSMLPSLWPGDTLVIERVESGAVSEGDIVLFGRDRRLFAHRVVAKSSPAGDTRILTRGDAMPQPDPPLSEHDMLGKVTSVVRNGKCIEPSRTPRLSERAVAALVRNSEIAARVVVGVHGMRQTS